MEERHYIIEKGRLKEIPNHKDLGNRTNRRWQNWYDFQSPNGKNWRKRLKGLIRTPSSWTWRCTPKTRPM